MGRRRLVGIAASAVIAATLALPGVAGASTRTARDTPVPVPPPVGQRTSHLTIALTSSDVKPGIRTEVLATVVPRTPGRSVTLKWVHGHRLITLSHAMTNGKGIAVLRFVPRHLGTMRLRAFVEATPAFSGVGSKGANENVAVEPPLVFPSLLRLQIGSTGADVLALQQRLSELGYWLGTPNGNFGDATQQAVYALQKAAGLEPTGIVGPQTVAALNVRVLPIPRTRSGDTTEIDLRTNLLMIVHNGALQTVLNTSTGGGYPYVQDGAHLVATTPTGVFQIFSAVNGIVKNTLGVLWRPRFFVAGYAIHGDSYVPSYPASHGCARVSNEAIDWIWATNQLPIGERVWVYRS